MTMIYFTLANISECRSKSSCLLEIPGMNLSRSLVQDPMPILTEGIIGKVFCLMVSDFLMVKKYFTLKWLNNAIQWFSDSYLEIKNKPEENHMTDINADKMKQRQLPPCVLCSLFHLWDYIIMHHSICINWHCFNVKTVNHCTSHTVQVAVSSINNNTKVLLSGSYARASLAVWTWHTFNLCLHHFWCIVHIFKLA